MLPSNGPPHLTIRSKTETVSVYTRHVAACSKKADPHWKRCGCVKYLYLLRNGKNTTVSSKTRSWAKAEQRAHEIRDSWDPIKQRLRELDDQQQTKELGEITIEDALARWQKTVQSDSDSANEHTFGKYQTAAKQIGAWSRRIQIVRVSQINPDILDVWKTSWSPKAKQKDDRIGRTTAGRRLEKVKGFLSYCLRMNWIATNPASDLKAIKPDESVTLPLLGGRYEQVIAATYEYDKRARRTSDKFGEDLRAIVELMRWTGLRIGDALLCARSRITGNKFKLRTRKNGTPLTVILPDHVVGALNALPSRSDVDPDFYFWSGKSKYKSLTGRWQRKLQRLNDHLTLADDEGKPMKFHSHQLRDTFAVTQLLSGTSMEDLSQMLSHKTIRITEKYYSPWVPERQTALEQKMMDALHKMGATASLQP